MNKAKNRLPPNKGIDAAIYGILLDATKENKGVDAFDIWARFHDMREKRIIPVTYFVEYLDRCESNGIRLVCNDGKYKVLMLKQEKTDAEA